MRVAPGRPDHVVLIQPGIHQGADRAGVPDRGDTADGLARPLTDRTSVGSSHLGSADQPGHLGCVHAVGAAGHDQERRPVRAEYEAVRDRPELTAELRGRRGGGRRAFRQFPQLARDAQVAEHGCESREVDWHACRLSSQRSAGEPITTACSVKHPFLEGDDDTTRLIVYIYIYIFDFLALNRPLDGEEVKIGSSRSPRRRRRPAAGPGAPAGRARRRRVPHSLVIRTFWFRCHQAS